MSVEYLTVILFALMSEEERIEIRVREERWEILRNLDGTYAVD